MGTPFSVLTNLAYVVAGLYILRGRERLRWHTPFEAERLGGRTRTLASWLVGLSFVALGIASGAFHWGYEPWAQLMDERGMYVAFSVLAGVLWARAYWTMPRKIPKRGISVADVERRKTIIVWLGLALGVILAATAHLPWSDSMYVMPALALLCIAGVGVGQSWGRALRFFIGFLAIAAIRELPETNFWARDPLFGYDIIHGGWHLFTGLFMYYLYKSTEG